MTEFKQPCGEVYTLQQMKFRRKFSVNPYKTLRLKLGEMSLFKDWIHTDRGDPYPILAQHGNVCETVADGRLTLTGEGSVTRLLGQHFPYATYEAVVQELSSAEVGFTVAANPEEGSSYSAASAPTLRIYLRRCENGVQIGHTLLVGGVVVREAEEETQYPFTPGMSLILGCRGRFFDVYLRHGKKPEPCLTLEIPEFSDITLYSAFTSSVAGLYAGVSAGGKITAESVEFYLDGGVSHADMRPIRYEDGTPMITDGKVFLTMSSRLEAGGFQSVISWKPSSCELTMEGAIFFDCGDGRWCSDVASSILYNRRTSEWYLWACSFSHGHVLCHGVSAGDLRYGINVVDVTLMECESRRTAGADALSAQAGSAASFIAALSNDRLWLAKSGDEDPDFIYDAERSKWYMTICRGVKVEGKTRYRYFLFESDKPFSGYTYLDQTRSGENTGGSILRIGGKLCFCCGSDFGARARYRVYDLPNFADFTLLECDYDDGGFRGWGTVIPVPCGNRIRYMWMTFDRHGGSGYNWSYGNIYVYEADHMNSAVLPGNTSSL